MDSSRMTALFFLVLFTFSIHGCTADNIQTEIFTIEDEEAERLSDERTGELSPDLADGLDVTLWASESLVRDPVALDVDDSGRVLVTSTSRRRNAELDIRSHPNWMIESIGFETVDDRRDFLLRELAPERSEQNDWLQDYNEDGSRDWRDLQVPEESVYRLEDLTGNGLANRSQLYHQGFNEIVSDVAGAVLYHEGDVFLGVAPDLWRIRDHNQDGYGERKESISHGFGVNIGFGGHGMSGLTTGPDGRIYWSIGDRGMSVEDQDGNRWHHPRSGVIVRSEPDGSDFEVFASGLRNTHEFVFDKHGNLITVDNDGDHSGEFERLVYLVNGSDSGWRVNWQFGKYDDPRNNGYNVLMEESYFRPRFEGQAAHLLPPISRYHNGPTGMAYNPGTALGEKWTDHFFVAEFVGSGSGSGIHAFTLNESGASFELGREEKVMSGLLATGLDFGPDGALYFADWIDGWVLKGEGRIWKMDSPAEVNSASREETRQLLASDFGRYESEALKDLLGHTDQRVRQNAQFELASRGDRDTLKDALIASNDRLQRIHGIWGLAQIGRQEPEAIHPVIPLLEDSDHEIRAQAAKMLGDNRYEPAANDLIPLLGDDHPRVRFFATEALGRMEWRPAFDGIVRMLEANDDEDVYLRHGGAIALARIGDEGGLIDLSTHPSTAVRVAAVVALRRLESPGVVRFLDDPDEFVVTNAARAINDDRLIEEGLDALATMTTQNQFLNEPLLRRAINANLYTGTKESADRLARFSMRTDVSDELRSEALQTLAVWEESSKLDRVTGDPREVVRNERQHAITALDHIIPGILVESGPVVKRSALNTIGALRYEAATSQVRQMLRNDPSPDVRIAALHTLIELEVDPLSEDVMTALDDASETVRMNALQIIPDLPLPEQQIVDLLNVSLEHGTVTEQQTSIELLATLSSADVEQTLSELVQSLRSGTLPRELELETLNAVNSSGSDRLRESVRQYRLSQGVEDSVSVYHEALYGGRAESGRSIFYNNAAAQCVRCHSMGGEGSTVGPDLTTVGSRLSREDLLESMVNPDRQLSSGYGSGMPPMGDLLTRKELRDLVEYLSSMRDRPSE